MAWVVSLVGLYVIASPFIFGLTGTYQISLVASGIIVAILAAYRGWQPDEKVPLPALPVAVLILGVWTILSTFLFGNGVSDTAGITLVIAGLIFIVVPAVMVNQMINKQHATEAGG